MATRRARGAARYRTAAVTILLATTPLAVTTLAAPAASARSSQISVTHTDLHFPDTYVGVDSSRLSVVLTNVSPFPLHPALAGGALIDRTHFHGDGQNCGTLAPGASCTFSYHFAPTKPGPLTDHTTIGVDGVLYPITLTGRGIASFTVAPTTLSFPDTVVGTTSPQHPVVLTNVSPFPLHPALAGGALIDRIDFHGDGQNCGTLAPGASCTFSYHFAPTKPGALTDHTTIGVGGTQYPITLTGTGLTGFTVAPTSLVFADTLVGSITPPLGVVLTNTTTTTLYPTVAGGSPAGGTDFVLDGSTCGGGVPAGGICLFRYHFAPTGLGTRTDHTAIEVNGGTFFITLSGTGITGIDLHPSTLTFSDTAVGTHSAPLHVTLTNVTSRTLHPGISGGDLGHATDFEFDGMNCPDAMGPGQECQADYTFYPASPGKHSDTAIFTISGQAVTIRLVGGHEPVTSTSTVHTTGHTTGRTTTHASTAHSTATHATSTHATSGHGTSDGPTTRATTGPGSSTTGHAGSGRPDPGDSTLEPGTSTVPPLREDGAHSNSSPGSGAGADGTATLGGTGASGQPVNAGRSSSGSPAARTNQAGTTETGSAPAGPSSVGPGQPSVTPSGASSARWTSAGAAGPHADPSLQAAAAPGSTVVDARAAARSTSPWRYLWILLVVLVMAGGGIGAALFARSRQG